MSTFAAYLNSQFTIPQLLEFLLRILVACFCGFCIGFERSKRYKEAGVRTHMIVCCAAAMIMIVSKYGFVDLTMAANSTNFLNGTLNGTRGADPARVAAQVVSGISFLGAGVIFKNGSTIKGLTTAAGLWATAGIGLAIGCGMYYIGLGGTVLIAFLQVIMHTFKIGGDTPTTRLALEVSNNEGFGEELSDLLKRWHAKVVETKINIEEDGSAKYDITLRTSEALSVDEIMKVFSSVEVIKNISCTTTE